MEFKGSDSLNFLLAQMMRLHYYRTHMLLAELGIYPGQPPILFLLWERDGRSQKEISEKLKLKPATVAVMLKRMERAGFIERRTDSEDLRVSRVYLAAKGRNIQKQVVEVLERVERECFKGFDQKDRELLGRFLLRMRENLQDACQEQEKTV